MYIYSVIQIKNDAFFVAISQASADRELYASV